MKIEELIDRYFEGQTSCDEERELRRFFTQENIPESLQVYRPLFACLDQEAKAFQKESIPAKKLSFRRRFIYMTGGIAAGLLPCYAACCFYSAPVCTPKRGYK